MIGPCLACTALPKCKKATPRMVELLEGCGLYDQTTEPTVLARVRAIELLGPDVVTKRRGKAQMSDAEVKAVATRKTLRAFAVHTGAAPKGDSYRMKVPELVNAITSVTDDDGNPVYGGIADWTDEQIRAVMDDKSAAKPAAKAPVKAKAKAEPKPEAQEEEAEAPAPPKPAKPAKAKPAGRKPAGRKPAARKPRKPAAAAAPAASGDNSLVESMVKDIGVMVEKQEKTLLALTTVMQNLEERIEAIDQHLCWAYNQGVNPGDEISNLSEISWT